MEIQEPTWVIKRTLIEPYTPHNLCDKGCFLTSDGEMCGPNRAILPQYEPGPYPHNGEYVSFRTLPHIFNVTFLSPLLWLNAVAVEPDLSFRQVRALSGSPSDVDKCLHRTSLPEIFVLYFYAPRFLSVFG
ncbi:hypothetical protein J6590_083482 [Homalodisca vitripennis]|nr:hypothetical protein J6590_083482 [Homalodisca vitripennis]